MTQARVSLNMYESGRPMFVLNEHCNVGIYLRTELCHQFTTYFAIETCEQYQKELICEISIGQLGFDLT